MQSQASPDMPARQQPHTAGAGASSVATSTNRSDLKIQNIERKKKNDNANIAMHDERDFY